MRRILITLAAIALTAALLLLALAGVFSGLIPIPAKPPAHVYTAIGAAMPDKGIALRSESGFVDITAYYRLPVGDTLPPQLQTAAVFTEKEREKLRQRAATWWWRPRADGQSRCLVIDNPDQRSHHTVIYEPARRLLFVYWYTY